MQNTEGTNDLTKAPKTSPRPFESSGDAKAKAKSSAPFNSARGPRQYIRNGDKDWQPSNTPGEPEPATFDNKPTNSTLPKKPKPTTSWKLSYEVNIEEYAQRPLRPGTKWSREETEGDRAMMIAELTEEPQTMEMTRAALRLGSARRKEARRLEARAREPRDEEDRGEEADCQEAEDVSDAVPKTRGK